MQANPSDPTGEQKLSNPMLIFHRQLKDKSLKKSSLESLTTISIALGRKKTREQLIPYLSQIFVQQSSQTQKQILKGFTQLLHPVYIGKSHHSRLILQIIMDILCVYSNREIREEAYGCLEKVFAYIDVRKAQDILVEALLRLDQEDDGNIRELVLRMVPYVYVGADGEREVQLMGIVNGFKTKPADQKLLSEMLTEFIKVMPPAPEAQIREIISLLIQTGDKTILSNLIEPVILLAKVSGEESTIGYLKQILEQADSTVICAALRKYWALSQIFAPQNLSGLSQKISQYDSQPQQIKNTILELLDSLPIPQQQMVKLTEPPASLQLKTTLSDTLCRVSDMKALLKLFNSSDPNFQAKLFPKLPPITELHVEIVEKIMGSKSWRQKLAVLQNVDARTDKGQPTHLLLGKLAEYLGDRIACVRVAVGQSIKNILIRHKIPLEQIESIIYRSLASKNWFERQSIHKMVLDLAKASPFHRQSKQQLLQIAQKGLQEKTSNISSIALELEALLTQK